MELNCEFDYFIGYECKVREPGITEPKPRITAIFGAHKTGKTNSDVTKIFFECETRFIPKGLDGFFPNITEIHIESRGLRSICREDLSQFKHLEILCVNDNQLTTLPDDLFKDTLKLKYINFDDNHIEYASSNLLKPIVNNKFIGIYFSENGKLDAFYSPLAFGSVKLITDLMAILDSSCKKPVPDPLPTSEALSGNLLAEHNEKSFKNFENLLVSGKFSDFVIVVNDSKRFNVHKSILAAQSEGFADAIEKDPKAVEMNIVDMRQEAVEEFLRYVYTGKLQNFEDKALEMFALASKIKVGNLKESMEEFAADRLDQLNAFKTFSIAHSFGSEKLKSAAFKEIQKMFPDKTLPESLKDDFQKVKKMMALKDKYDGMLKELDVL